MISEAYTQRCTCYDTWAGDILPCPQHGLTRTWQPGDTLPAMPAGSADYDRGFRAGIEAAMKMMHRSPGG
jgi:hypothetical protein